MTEELAILGGPKLRTAPFTVEPMIDEDEEAFVLEAIRERNFSRYIGVAVEREVLEMPSAEAAALDDYWHFLGGPNVRHFAAEFAARMDVPYAIPVTSATAGLGIALAAAGVGPGDEVILPALSFSATANAVLMFGSIPVFVDVDPDTFCMDPEQVEKAISPRTRALLPVHLTGNVSDMDALLAIAEEHQLKVIEDAAQAIGGKWGNRHTGALGDAGVFSFQQSKNIMTGEGGMIITSNPDIAARARRILNHGELTFADDCTDEELANVIGFNFRMPELCAALGRAQLKKLDAVNQWRTDNANVLYEELSGIEGIVLPPRQQFEIEKAQPVPHFFVALFDAEAAGMSRDLFVAALREEGIPIGTGYTRTLYGAPLYQRRIAYGRDGYPWNQGGEESPITYPKGLCPVAEALLEDRFLWLYHIAYSSTKEDMRDVAAAVRKVMANRDALVAAEPRLRDKLGGHSSGRIGIAPQQLKKG